MASQRIGGTAFLKVDGVQYAIRGKWEYNPMTVERTGVAGQDGVHGYTEKPAIPSMKGDVSDLGGVSVRALQNITSSVITLELLNGKVIVLANAWWSGKTSVNTEEGSYAVEFEGTSCIEQVAA